MQLTKQGLGVYMSRNIKPCSQGTFDALKPLDCKPKIPANIKSA